MEIWRKIPSWFNLANYRDLGRGFNSGKWATELVLRSSYFAAIMRPQWYLDETVHLSNEETDQARDKAWKFFNHIKKNGLASKIPYKRSEEWSEFVARVYPHGRTAVQDLIERDAYSFFCASERKEEIERDLSYLELADQNEDTFWELENEKKRALIFEKYGHPIANILDRSLHGNHGYLTIDLDASDEQIFLEFKNWLTEVRVKSDGFVKRQFSLKDFEDWHLSRVLPYWDLTSIAAIENATIPFHVLGEALFPEEFGVDLAERVRKVTKRKCQVLFSTEVMYALHVQGRSEQ